MMNNPEDAARAIKGLLERLHQLQLAPDAGDQASMLLDSSRSSHPHAKPQVGAGARSSTLSPWLFVLATALNTIVAAVLAVLITLGVVHQEAMGPAAVDGRISVAPAGPAGATQIMMLTRPIGLLPVGSPDRPLILQPSRPSRLPLQIQPDEARQETFILVLSGLPAKANLSGAERMGSDSWLLPPDSIGKLEITLAEWSASLMEVDVELRRTNGAIAARSKAWIKVPPPPMPAAARLDQTALTELVKKADQLLGRGDVVSARILYERAAELGSGPAALALGSTYDPRRLWSLGVFGMVGNTERARLWYIRADQLGHPDAKERVRMLGN